MSPVLVACLLVLSVVPACHAQSFDACDTPTTNAIGACLVTGFGAAAAEKLMLQIASDDFPGMTDTICGVFLSITTLDTMFSCLKPELAKCDQTDTIVKFFTGASGADIQDICKYRTQCPKILESMQAVESYIALLKAAGPNTVCTLANSACVGINATTKCPAARNAQLYSARTTYAYCVAKQNSCSDSAVSSCNPVQDCSTMSTTMSTTCGSMAVGPAIMLVATTVLFRFL